MVCSCIGTDYLFSISSQSHEASGCLLFKQFLSEFVNSDMQLNIQEKAALLRLYYSSGPGQTLGLGKVRS